MFIKILLTLFISINLYSANLQRNYFVQEDTIKLSDIAKEISAKEDRILFRLSNTKHIKRIRAKKLIKILEKHGLKGYVSRYPYIQFNKISPIDTARLRDFLEKHYKSKYKSITIKKMEISPRYYMDKLPKNYTIEIRKKEHLSNEGIVAIESDNHRKYFFNYKLKASLPVLTLRKDCDRNTELSRVNTAKNSIILEKFTAMPLQSIKNGSIELKHKMEKGSLLTERDVEPLTLIRRGELINVTLHNGSILINFSARALQNGTLGDRIFVETNKKKKVKVTVTGKNKAKTR
ncbi:MAG: flagellar basal body P-ring formation chaperone FlgA [Sulfurimonas sp.]